MAWTAYSNHLLVATGNTAKSDMGSIDVLSLNDSELTLQSSTAAHTSNCYCLEVDPNFQKFAVGSADFLVSLWDLDDFTCYKTITSLE